MIIDFHSHILPGIDDGARNIETSMGMLSQVREQQVDIMVATPHFYASRDRIDTFLKRREEARDAFLCAIREEEKPGTPKIERFWHFDLITSMSLEKFTEEYIAWAKEKKYHRSRSKAEAV